MGTLPLSLVAHSSRPSSLCCRLSVSMSKLSSLERRRDMLLLLSVLAFGSAADGNLAKEERENCSCFHDQDAVLSILD